ncbi:serine/threonine-protein kinase [Sphingomonas immobilis]|uniref:Serine/threonine-protein kinase n=1 Tax=Sphingomonas immobilis TaxID=3063997 RepID=A0ABT8ZYP2_9SPHN|nr:serine/threonine-protein kinase [Sphingomonas sp. CA1-15]MDO7842697.1 serine/threonine-protein kinase [Sphingomonas sp. CA1-15]
MSDDLERTVLALFEASLEVPEADRDAWIAQATQGRPDLAARLQAMRAADRLSALETGGAIGTLDEELPPERIGAYRIVERIGRGGMGSVYRGERDTGDFGHVVAIKIIKPGLLSEVLVERFQRERQTLAGLTHPNIAQLYDGGETEGGSPYIVMEHVDGLPLLDWVAEHRPSRAQRVRLYCDICAAVAFAHRALVIHRDLTPSNVLVTQGGVVKLIDFGIARPLDAAPAGDAPSIGSLSLTPGYAAPERLTSNAVTTAADVYSLGKLLEKLLPPGPGDRELVAIVARATASDPLARYATVDALADDVAAWNGGFPVSAVAGGKRYRFGKFLGRHRLGAAAVTAATLLLVGALALTLAAYTRAQTAQRAEAARFEELRSLARYMVFDLNGRLGRVVGNTAARVSLAGRAQRYLSALAAKAGADDALKLEAAQGFVALANAQGVPAQPNLGDLAQARANIASAVGMLRAIGGPVAATDLVQALTARAMIEAHGDSRTDAATATLAEAEKVLAGIAPADRSQGWHDARRKLRRAQLELATLQNRPDRLAQLASRLESDIAEWPSAMRASRLAELDRAYAAHYRGLRGYLVDALDEGVVHLLDAEARFARLEAAVPNDPVVLYARMYNAYIGYGTATGLAGRESETKRFIAIAHDANERLLKIEANDISLRSFGANVRQIESQNASTHGRHAEAIALQTQVLALFEAAAGPTRRAAALNRLVAAEVTMGNIARAAGDRALACESYRRGQAVMRELEGRRELLDQAKRFQPGLKANIEGCAGDMPLAKMAIFG